MIVNALHPAPATFVPARGRNERFAMLACRSPVELREDALSRSVEVGLTFPDKQGVHTEPLRELDGRLWTPVTARDGAGEFREAGLGEFVDWMAGLGSPTLAKHFDRQFAGTPLVAIAPDAKPTSMVMFRGVETRGSEIDVSGAREVRRDGRETSRAQVSLHVSEEIRVLDGRPFMRAAPVLWINGVTTAMNASVASRIWPEHPGMRAFPVTPGTIEAAVGILRGLGVIDVDQRMETIVERWRSLVADGHVEGDDVRTIVNEFAGPLRRSIDETLEAVGMLARRDRLETARDSLLPIETAAMTGTAHRDGDAPVRAMRVAIEAWRSHRRSSYGQEFLGAFLDRVVIPRMDAGSADDHAHLASLGMS